MLYLPFFEQKKEQVIEKNAYVCNELVENMEVEIDNQLPISSTFEHKNVESKSVLENEIDNLKVENDVFDWIIVLLPIVTLIALVLMIH